jgi:hypothetical protein
VRGGIILIRSEALLGPKGRQEAKVCTVEESKAKAMEVSLPAGDRRSRIVIAGRARVVPRQERRHRGCWRSVGTRLGHTGAHGDMRTSTRALTEARSGRQDRHKDGQTASRQRTVSAGVLFCMNVMRLGVCALICFRVGTGSAHNINKQINWATKNLPRAHRRATKAHYHPARAQLHLRLPLCGERRVSPSIIGATRRTRRTS